jgi:hypothetical protein
MSGGIIFRNNMTLFINKKRTNNYGLAATATHTYSALQYNLHRICSRVISGGGTQVDNQI